LESLDRCGLFRREGREEITTDTQKIAPIDNNHNVALFTLEGPEMTSSRALSRELRWDLAPAMKLAVNEIIDPCYCVRITSRLRRRLMSLFEVSLSVASIIAAVAGLYYVHHIVKTSGRDRPRDPVAVWKLIEKTKKTSVSQAS
jgi:hypothetical protein